MTPKPPEGYAGWVEWALSPGPATSPGKRMSHTEAFEIARAELAALRSRLAAAEARVEDWRLIFRAVKRGEVGLEYHPTNPPIGHVWSMRSLGALPLDENGDPLLDAAARAALKGEKED